jgi:antitoxin component YwqK of YwqJK toxin-antitoxin module
MLDFDEDLVYTLNGERFTGVGFEDVPSSGLSEIAYVDGLQEGLSRAFYPNGGRRAESVYKANSLHGPTREFASDGTLLRECG